MKHFYTQIKKILNIALFLGIFLQNYSANAQTTLLPGDLLFTSYDSNFSAAAGDAFSFVLLTNISAGTVIRFTDRGYFGSNTWQAAIPTDATVTWTSATALPAGTEILIKGFTASTYNPTTTALTANGTVTGTEGTPANGLSLANVGDQIVAFQSATGSVTASPTFIAGLHYNYCSANGGTTTANWDGVDCADGPNSSIIPPSLIGGTNALYTGYQAPSVYTSGKLNTNLPLNTIANIRTAVMNPANWQFSTSTTAGTVTVPSGYAFLSSPPAITSSPANRTTCPGSNTTFTVVATNTTSYQWQLNTGSGYTDISNGAPYSGATTATLTITGVTTAMSGYTYRCVATGSGTATSSDATLTVPTALTPSVSTQANVSTYGGNNGSATIAVSGGTFPYFYSWSPSGGTGITANNLSAGTYTVTITDSTPNGLGGCTVTQNVTITQPPGVTASVTSLSPFTSCNAAVSTPQSFTISGGSLTSSLNVSAPTGYELGLSATGSYSSPITFFPSAGTVNTTTIYARLTNTATGTPSGNITVSSTNAVTQNVAVTGVVTAAPAITTAPAASDICSGANTTFSVTASNATGYQWQVDQGAGFGNITNNATYSGTTTATLTITGATAGMNGYQYRAVATGCSPSATSAAATLTVNPSPSITTQPSNSAVCPGANTTFTVIANNAIGYQWQVNTGSGFTDITNDALYSGATTSTLTITGATAVLNNYSYRVVVGGNCSTSITSGNATLTINTAPTITGQPTASSICAGANTTFTGTASNATGYQWQVDQGTGYTSISNGAPYSGATTATLTITGATAGLSGYIYRLVATGTCTPIAVSNGAALTVNSAPAITAQPSNSTICAGANTTFTANAANATGYQWQVNQGAGYTSISDGVLYSGATTATLTITGATAGLNGYLYRVTATGGCSPAATSNGVSLTINAAPSITAQPSNSTICAGANTTFAATVANATTYQWEVNEGAGFNTITNNAVYSGATTTTLTITSATASLNGFQYRLTASGGCTPAATSNAATITVNSAPVITSQPVNQTVCIGSNTTITAAASNATGYQWQVNQGLGFANVNNNALYSGATTATLTITGATAGLNGYTYRLIANGSCTPFAVSNSATLTVPNIVANATQVNIRCNGDADGSITLAPSGGTGPYTYLWSNSATTETISSLAPGVYTVTITDANLCVRQETFTITQPPVLVSTTSSTSVSCNGGSNGAASVGVSGGTPGYTYAWAPLGGTSSSISGRPAGDYTCTITDANGCILIKNITIQTPPPFVGTISKTDVSCNGGANGTATIVASGATAPYTYSWSPTGGTGATATGLTAGTYTVTITDDNNCIYQRSITVGQPDLLTVTTSKTDVICNGTATGTATVIPSGGNGNYTYQWRNASNTLIGTASTITGLVAGNYNCTITDGVGCFTTANFTIFQPSSLTAATTQIDATCSGPGTATVIPSGGTPGYTYLWSPTGITTATASLQAGAHSCLITDANGCTVTRNFIIGTTNTLVASQSQVDVLCNGSNTGSASVVATGAPGPMSYVWFPSGGNGDTASNLAAGNYSVTITASNGCSIVKNFTITQPTALVVTSNTQTNVSCNGGNNGSASVTVTGGTGAYTYQWSPSGGTAATANGLAAGTYTVTIKDANLCQTTQTFIITQPAAIIATTSKTDVSCNGGSNGTATVSVTGGTGTYSYAWAPSGGTAATASGLTSGTYTVTITDANACQTTATVTIAQPTLLTATISKTDVSCNGASDGTATVTAAGGTSPYTYSWSPSGGTAAIASGLSPNTYTVTVTDANGCFVTQSVTIGTIQDLTPPVPNVAVLPEIVNYCSVLASEIPIPTATDNCAGTITAFTTTPLNYNTVGTYTVVWIYNDGNGNGITQPQTIKVLESPLSAVTFNDAQFTYDGNAHSLQVANLPTGATVTYSANNGSTNAGTYVVTATITPAASSPNCSPIVLTANLVINKATQQITFGAIPVKTLGANNNFNLTATSSSGLPVTYTFTYTSALAPATVSSTGAVTMLRSGQGVITAHQTGNSNYLPAADVSQTLVILNNNIDVKSITLGSKVYDNPGKTVYHLLACGETNPSVSILNESDATITPSANFTIQTPKPGIYTQNATITSQDGSTSAVYSITVEKPFAFFDIVTQKFNNVLLVNNNPQTNGGYEFVAYQWFKNGQLIGTGQYYSAGESTNNTLDPTADYSVKMTTKDGKVLQTCNSKITLTNKLEAKLYPNPVLTGKMITIEADFPEAELQNMQISLYSITGQLVKTVQSSSVKTEIQLPPTIESSMYLVVLETPNVKKSFKVIVK